MIINFYSLTGDFQNSLSSENIILYIRAKIMSGIRKSQRIEESAKKPMLDAEISDKLTDTKKIPDVVWQQIFGFFSLEEIKLKVAMVCRHFFEISNDCVQIYKMDFKIFGSKHKFEMFNALPTFKYLKTISIQNSYRQDYTQSVDFLLMHVLKNCPRLRHLEIWSHELSIGFIRQIVQHGQNLHSLTLDFEFTDKSDGSDILSPLLTGMTNLKHLGLVLMEKSHCKNEDLLALVDNCKQLNSLTISACDVDSDTMCKLINLKIDTLKYLDFQDHFPGPVFLIMLLLLENCQKFESLNLGYTEFPKFGFEAISKLKNLKSLQLGNYRNEYGGGEFYGYDVFEMLSNGKFNKLKILRVYGIVGSIVPILMCAALSCPNLQILECECKIENRKVFPKNIIKVLFENLLELRKLIISWFLDDDDSKEDGIFIKAELEEILGKLKKKFRVEVDKVHEVNENDDRITITRE